METNKNIKHGYEYLSEMTAIRSEFNSRKPQVNPINSRVAYILSELEELGVEFEKDIFQAAKPTIYALTPNYINIYVNFQASKKTDSTIVFLAHHDVVNVSSENCNDNTASVCNLLHLCGILKEKELKHNVVVAFTDAEEICSHDYSGSARLGELINSDAFGNVLFAINLELTANGGEIYYDHYDKKSKLSKHLEKTADEIYNVQTPFNDSVVLRKRGIDSICIGTLTTKEMLKVVYGGFCPTWGLCHKKEDTFEKANGDEMSDFVNFLVKLTDYKESVVNKYELKEGEFEDFTFDDFSFQDDHAFEGGFSEDDVSWLKGNGFLSGLGRDGNT
jgi:hypothetical protein